MVNIGTDVILYNNIDLLHTQAEASVGKNKTKNMLTAFKILNKSSLHHEFKQQKHNIKSHNCLLFVNHSILLHFTVFNVGMHGYLITIEILVVL